MEPPRHDQNPEVRAHRENTAAVDGTADPAHDAAMDEPVGRTIEGTPWEEPRGPHLPDRLTSLPGKLPRASWAFLALAIANGIVLAVDRFFLPDPSLDPALFVRSIVGQVLGLIPPVATMLFGAAVFARNPSAWSTHRSVAVGVLLLAASQMMQTAGIWVRGLLDDPFGAASTAYSLLVAVVLAMGFVAVARGLRVARLRPDGGGSARRDQAIVVGLVLLVVWTVAVGLLALARYASDNPDVNAWYNLVLIGASWLTIASIGYLAIVVSAGAAAGERPAAAWRLAMAGTWLIIAATTISLSVSNVAYLVVTPSTDFSILTWIGLGTSTLAAVGYLLLLAAFARGLPADGRSDVEAPAPTR